MKNVSMKNLLINELENGFLLVLFVLLIACFFHFHWKSINFPICVVSCSFTFNDDVKVNNKTLMLLIKLNHEKPYRCNIHKTNKNQVRNLIKCGNIDISFESSSISCLLCVLAFCKLFYFIVFSTNRKSKWMNDASFVYKLWRFQ